MGEKMTMIPFDKLMNWALREYREQGTVFGVRKFYKNESGSSVAVCGDVLASPLGPAAGPNAQLAQNIVAAYLAGSRFIELKTVQVMDGEELRRCVPRPCINAQDEGYNVEWSTELTVPDAFDEYVKGWFAVHVLARELGLGDRRDFAYNMSVGYDLEGIKSPKIDRYIEDMKDASRTDIWRSCTDWLRANLHRFTSFGEADLAAVSPRICSSITLSTLHGCPPDEIERIAKYLLDEKNVHTYVKCNPTLLGYDFARGILDEMGYGYLSFDDHHFKNDLQYAAAVSMLERLMAYAAERKLAFGVKITNTFPVKIKRGELPGEEMYMSGRALYPLSLSVANKLSQQFDGRLPISYSGGADAFNIQKLFAAGIQPITVATTILKPGGYERLKQLAELLEPLMRPEWSGVDTAAIKALAEDVVNDENHRKEKRETASRKTDSVLPLFDCFKAPCKEGGCPIHQQIPEYLSLAAKGAHDKAFQVIAIDNALPSITGEICNHACQAKCTRLDYDSPLEIRGAKRLAAEAAQESYIAALEPPALKTGKKAAVIGAGPAGVSAGLFLRRNGVDTTVLEQKDRPLGVVEHVIPAFRIPGQAIGRDFRMAEKMGVRFQFGVGPDYDVAVLRREYDFVVIATGAWKEGAVPVKQGGDKLLNALEFLQESKRKDCKVPLGRTVAVLGGGDVAMDCARAAKRAPGVEKVTIVYRRTKDFMPAEPEEIRLALGDGVELLELLGPVSYDGGALVCERMRLGDWDASGRRGVEPTGEQRELHFDAVISAVGARVDTALFEKNGLALDQWGRPVLSAAHESSVDNVYVAGDCRRGAATIVRAVADAKEAAIDILSKLGLPNDFTRVSLPQDEETLYARKGVLCASSLDDRDALRCLGCDQICEICCDVCPNRANVRVITPGFSDRHQILHLDGMCNECGNCGVFCPHTGNPYKDKLTLFWTEQDFADSENKGFLHLGGGQYRIKLTDGSVTTCAAADAAMPAGFRSMIRAVEEQYSYYL